ncbi:hypothetical protein CC80DRAFT_562786 [Byssothecium circinans]|uniref:Uncharacterized protein n=1 Tax=Byssothecium circinans TaxID=147558 RepID=A0A6A5TU37_9PLEO|nr:hypothetical protein CC80DRAFT_562786 [Byssothecium circinans]
MPTTISTPDTPTETSTIGTPSEALPLPFQSVSMNTMTTIPKESHEQPLTEAFSKGWLSLPVELKLHVFGFINANKPECERTRRITWRGQQHITERIIFFAKCSPEFKALAHETLYKQEVFELKHCSDEFDDDELQLPPRSSRHFIHHLEVFLDMGKHLGSSITLIQGLQDNTLGFTNLKHLSVQFHFSVPGSVLDCGLAILDEKIRFHARSGNATVCRAGYFLRGSFDMQRCKDDIKEAEQLTQENFTFGMD